VTLYYRLEITPDDNDSLLVTCPALPEVTTSGKTLREALLHARDAIEEAIAARIAADQDIPVDEPSSEVMSVIRMRLLSEMKTQLYLALRQNGITRAELAHRLRWKRESVHRLFRLNHASRVGQLEAAFEALGLRIDVEVHGPA
jgi:antitoxin HicB